MKQPTFSCGAAVCTVTKASTSTINILSNDRPTGVSGEGRQAKEFGLEKDAILSLSMAC